MGTRTRLLLIALLLISLSGCETTGQKRYKSAVSTAERVKESYSSCVRAIQVSGAYVKNIAMNSYALPSLTRKLIPDYASEQLKEDVVDVTVLRSVCNDRASQDYRDSGFPRVAQIYSNAKTERESLVAQLVRDEITVGRFNEASELLNKKYERHLVTQSARFAAETTDEHNRELQKRQRRGAILAQMGKNLEAAHERDKRRAEKTLKVIKQNKGKFCGSLGGFNCPKK